MRKFFIFVFIFCLSPSWVFAQDQYVLSGFISQGKKSTAEDFLEEKSDEEYRFSKYSLNLKDKGFKGFKFDLGYLVTRKDYSEEDVLDNRSYSLNNNWEYYLRKDKEQSLKFKFELTHQQKRYPNSAIREYDRLRIAPVLRLERKDLYVLEGALGINDYNFLETGDKDQTKFFTRLSGKRFLLDKKLFLSSGYKVNHERRETLNRQRSQHNVDGGLEYKFDNFWLYKFSLRAFWGERDSKEEEESDDDFDYRYKSYIVKTTHKLREKIQTSFKYCFQKKDYFSADLDSSVYYVENRLNYELLEDKVQRLSLLFIALHKEADYSLKRENEYKKETAEFKVAYNRKGNYKFSGAVRGDFYDYFASFKDKRVYYGLVYVEKCIGELLVFGDFQYKYNNYKQQNNNEHLVLKVGFKGKY